MTEATRREEFETFFRAQYASVVRALALATLNPLEAEELAQEAFARVYERWDRVQGMESPAGYVYRIGFNLHRRRHRLRRRSPHWDSSTPDPLDEAVDVRQAIGALPVPQRQAIVLVEWLGYSAEEAGKILGIRAVSVRGRLHRARETLRTRFADYDG